MTVQFHTFSHRGKVLFTYKEFKLVQNISGNMLLKFWEHTFYNSLLPFDVQGR